MLTVVIPTHRRNDLLARTLASLAECARPEEYARTIVIENGGRHGAEEVAESAADWLNVQYLYHEQGNKSAALNRVLEHVGDEVLVFFDDDVRLDPGVLTAYAKAAKERKKAFYGGPVAVDYETPPEDWIKLPASARGWSLPDGTTTVEKPEFLGFNWAAYAADLRDCGGFNPAVGPGGTSGGRGQEWDMQWRLLTAGWTGIYVPDALVWHYVPQSRCSVEWSLRRIYEAGVTRGMSDNAEYVTIFGYPLPAVRELFRRYARIVVFTMARPEVDRYHERYRFHRCRGYLKGYKHAHSQRRLLATSGTMQSRTTGFDQFGMIGLASGGMHGADDD